MYLLGLAWKSHTERPTFSLRPLTSHLELGGFGEMVTKASWISFAHTVLSLGCVHTYCPSARQAVLSPTAGNELSIFCPILLKKKFFVSLNGQWWHIDTIFIFISLTLVRLNPFWSSLVVFISYFVNCFLILSKVLVNLKNYTVIWSILSFCHFSIYFVYRAFKYAGLLHGCIISPFFWVPVLFTCLLAHPSLI